MTIQCPTKLLCSAVLLAAAGLSSSVSAANFPYNYLEVRVPLSPGGLGVAGSQLIHQNAHVIVEAESHFDDDWVIGGGVGFNAPVNQFTDLTGQVKLLSIKNEEYNQSLGRIAAELKFGLSAWILPRIETGAHIGVIAADEDITTFNVYGRFHASEAFSMGAEWRVAGIDDHVLAFSVRYPF